MKQRRIIALLLAAIFAFGLLAGCAAKPSNGAVMTVAGQDVLRSEYTYYLNYFAYQIVSLQGGSDVRYADLKDLSSGEGEKSINDYLFELVDSQMIQNSALNLMFQEYGLTLDETKVEKLYNEVKGTKSDKEFEEMVGKFGVSSTEYKDVLRTEVRRQAVMDYLFGEKATNPIAEEEVTAYIKSNYQTFRHILVLSKADDLTTDLSAEDYAKAEKKFAEVKAKVEAGEDFDALVKAYNEDEDQPETGYSFDKENNSFDKSIVEALSAMAESETRVVEVAYGWTIIKKLPVNVDANKESAETNLQGAAFTSIFKPFSEKAEADVKRDDAAIAKIQILA